MQNCSTLRWHTYSFWSYDLMKFSRAPPKALGFDVKPWESEIIMGIITIIISKHMLFRCSIIEFRSMDPNLRRLTLKSVHFVLFCFVEWDFSLEFRCYILRKTEPNSSDDDWPPARLQVRISTGLPSMSNLIDFNFLMFSIEKLTIKNGYCIN